MTTEGFVRARSSNRTSKKFPRSSRAARRPVVVSERIVSADATLHPAAPGRVPPTRRPSPRIDTRVHDAAEGAREREEDPAPREEGTRDESTREARETEEGKIRQEGHRARRERDDGLLKLQNVIRAAEREERDRGRETSDANGRKDARRETAPRDDERTARTEIEEARARRQDEDEEGVRLPVLSTA
eukprot:31497-Pelagococcus_subviridis.AAC.90